MDKWVFEELRGAAVRRDPNEAELFKTEQTGEGEYAGNDALVREILQNSLDAGHGGSPVTVRLAVHDPKDAPDRKRLAHYFNRLRAPLIARQVAFDGDGCPNLHCRFLVCEDFGTRGLEGDVSLFRDPQPGHGPRQDFYWFWRNIGRSGKTGEDLGRWGLGKTVYRAASSVGCMFGLTVRRSDRNRLLMGQAVLQIHTLDGKEYMPEGYWCATQNADGLPLPVEDESRLDSFCREWHVTRTNESGLSVVVPFVHEDLKAERVLQAVAVHFFTRIVRGELIVEVSGGNLGAVTLDHATIEAACQKMNWDGPKRTKRHVAPPITFAKSCVKTPPAEETNVLGETRLPDLDDTSFDEATIHRLRGDFAAGHLVSVRVRMWLPRRVGAGQEGQVDVYLRRLADGTRCDTYYVREGMTITKLNSRAALRGVEALAIVDSGPLAELLGDTEGPAHEDWDTSAERPDRTWKTWKGRVKFARRVVDALVELLTPATTEPDFDLLSDYFSIERTRGEQRQRQPGKESESSIGFETIVPVPKWFHINERAGGFTIGQTGDAAMPENPMLKVSVAYDIPRGDPLRNWSPIDFTLDNKNGTVRVKGRGVEGSLLHGNVVELRVTEPVFQFVVDGFDRHRDLFVRVDDVSRTTEAAE